jgi:hypothetical protein
LLQTGFYVGGVEGKKVLIEAANPEVKLDVRHIGRVLFAVASATLQNRQGDQQDNCRGVVFYIHYQTHEKNFDFSG